MVPLTVGNRKSAVMEKLSVENDVRGLFILGVCIIYSLVLFTIAAATHAAFVIVRTALGGKIDMYLGLIIFWRFTDIIVDSGSRPVVSNYMRLVCF